MNTQKARLFQKLEISVASPKQIRRWAERFLPNGEIVGEVTSPETVNYKTLNPEPHGLFCQKIFGPVVDFTCACGKKSTKVVRKTKLFGRGFCPKCGVERTYSRVRRYRLGFIKLKQPVVHPLYASHRPSPLGLCLNWPTKRIQSVIKTVEFCCLPLIFTTFRSNSESLSFFQKESQITHSSSIQTRVPFLKKGLVLFPKIDAEDKTGAKLSQPLEKNPIKAKKPRLFTRIKKAKRPLFLFNHGIGEARLYGIAYDSTWRQVEEFQEFLFYLWEQSFFYESSIPYYAFVKAVKTHNKEIPRHKQSYAIQTGGFALQHIVSHLDIRGLQNEITGSSAQGKVILQIIQEKIAALDFRYTEDRKQLKRLRIKWNRLQRLLLKWQRQLEYFRDFEQGNIQPAWMVLSYLPVLPPGLRPIISIRGELVVSDINNLYRKVLIRNKRITRGTNFGVFDTALAGSWLSWCYNLRLVQDAVDELLKTGSKDSGRPLKSLLQGLKGKQGRFRQHLLGKRVDYSGRSVIVVGPELKLHQCGLPRKMAIELFQPFIIQKLTKKRIVFTTTAAKALIAEQKPIVWSLLGGILRTHPVFLNRAPTLHRLGIQAFLPQLVEGKAILLHPLVCPAFNADFDGDQMAVHVPLSAKTRAEALNLVWSRNHVLAPSSGQPLLLPTQDMVLGFYYLTCSLEKDVKPLENSLSSQRAVIQNQALSEKLHVQTVKTKTTRYFSELSQVKAAYDRGLVTLHTPIWLRWSGFVQTFLPEHQSRSKETVLETRLDVSGQQETVFLDNCQVFSRNPNKNLSQTTQNQPLFFKKSHFLRTTPGRVFMNSWVFETN